MPVQLLAVMVNAFVFFANQRPVVTIA